MAKAKVKTVVAKCRCSTCQQVAFVEPGKAHHYCRGLEQTLVDRLPVEFKDLTNPKRKGTWEIWTAPVVVESVPEETSLQAELGSIPEAILQHQLSERNEIDALADLICQSLYHDPFGVVLSRINRG